MCALSTGMFPAGPGRSAGPWARQGMATRRTTAGGDSGAAPQGPAGNTDTGSEPARRRWPAPTGAHRDGTGDAVAHASGLTRGGRVDDAKCRHRRADRRLGELPYVVTVQIASRVKSLRKILESGATPAT